MRLAFIIICSVVITGNSCSINNTHDKSQEIKKDSTLELLAKFPYAGTTLLKKGDHIIKTALNGNEISILFGDRLLNYNTVTESLTINQKISSFIKKHVSALSPSDLNAVKNRYYIRLFDSVFCIDKEANIIFQINYDKTNTVMDYCGVDTNGSVFVLARYRPPNQQRHPHKVFYRVFYYNNSGELITQNTLHYTIPPESACDPVISNNDAFFDGNSTVFLYNDIRKAVSDSSLKTLKLGNPRELFSPRCASSNCLFYIHGDSLSDTVFIADSKTNMVLKKIVLSGSLFPEYYNTNEYGMKWPFPEYQVLPKNDHDYFITEMKKEGLYIYYLKV